MKIVNTLYIFIFSLFIGTGSLKAQIERPKELKDFIITIEEVRNEIILKAVKGCSWKELTLDSEKRFSELINEYGKLPVIISEEDKNKLQLANFSLAINKRNNMIIIYGMKGTAWKKLTLLLNTKKKYTIHQLGVVQ